MSLDVWLEVTATPFEANITHNLTHMAEAAGLYGVLWRPEENGIQCAQDLIKPLSKGLQWLRADPERFNVQRDAPQPCGQNRLDCRGCSDEDCPFEQHKQLTRAGMLSLIANVRRNGRLL